MSGEDKQTDPASSYNASGSADVAGGRYSLKEMMEEVKIERRDSVFGRELVDSTEIDKMFSKQIRKKKRK